MELISERSIAIIRKDTLIEMYEYGTGRALGESTLRERLGKYLDSKNRKNAETTPVEKTFLEMANGFLLSADFEGDGKPLIMALAIIPRDGMALKEIYAELKEQDCHPTGFSQAMCFFHGFAETEGLSLGRIPHFGTIFPDKKRGTAIAVTRGKRLDSFVPYPYGTFKAGTQIVVIREERVFKKK